MYLQKLFLQLKQTSISIPSFQFWQCNKTSTTKTIIDLLYQRLFVKVLVNIINSLTFSKLP